MIIFGWGRQTIKQIGVVFKKLCGHCNNEEYWILTRTITWFTLFFIPIIPYSVKYFLSCPVCKYGFDLNSKQVDEIKPLAEINQLLVDGKITEAEYHSRINLLNGDSPSEPAQIEVLENKVLPEGNVALSYCGSCGTSITKELKFCGNCGTQVIAK
jgi:hypothetical protein